MHHPFHVISDCIITAVERCQDLNSIGMDLTSTFDNLIKKELIAAIQDHTTKCDLEILKAVAADRFILLPPDTQLFTDSGVSFSVPIPKLSQSALDFYSVLTKFGSDIGMLINFSVFL